jgi:adenosylcobinamide-GDP ribazoletransferase
MLLTRLPIAQLVGLGGPPDLARCVWAFPLVGLVVNGLGSLVYWLAYSAGMSPLLAAAWSMTATTVVTGALHEDGLADTADGWGGGATRARKLEIMRDSRIGTYGVLALLLSMTLRVAAIAELGRPANVAAALIVAGMLGRGGMLVMIMPLVPARSDGMGHSLGGFKTRSAWFGLVLATAAVFACLSPQAAFVTIALGFGASLVFARLAYTQIGGFTGDVLGASEVVTECIVLSTVAWHCQISVCL